MFCCSGPACSQLTQHNAGGLQRAWAGSAALALPPPSRSPGKLGKALRDLHRDHGQPGIPSSRAKFPLHGKLYPQSFILTWAISIGPTALVLYTLIMSSASTVSSDAVGV